MLPQDPIILLSYINTQLRDNYKSLDALAEGLDLSEEELSSLKENMKAVGYEYDSSSNQFR